MAKLTVKQLQSLSASEARSRLSDGDGLYGVVRSSTSGISVLFRWRYRFDGKLKDFNCGTWPAKTLAEIREARRQAESALKSGADPMEDRRASRLKKQADQAEAVATQQTRLEEIAAKQARMTVKELFERWERLELNSRKDKGAEVRRSFEKDVFPTLGDVAAEDVTRAMTAACLDKVVERGARIIARNLLGDIRQMFGFAIKREYVENDPTSHLKRDDFGKKVERDRVLNTAEIKKLADQLPQSELGEAQIAAIWMMLSTCCRVGEIIQARWEDIDFENGVWRVPPDISKNGKEHLIYLSAFALQRFAQLRCLVENAAKDKGGNFIDDVSPWVMPAMNVDSHVCVKSLSKQVGDRQRGDKAPMKNRTKLTMALELPRGKWTPHDLRRTGATMMGELGVRTEVIEKCLNHIEQNRLVRIYQRQSLANEQREAWHLLGERLELLLRAESNVVLLSEMAA